jgi:hypothetical protein
MLHLLLGQSDGATHWTQLPLAHLTPPFWLHAVPSIFATSMPIVPEHMPVMHWFMVVGGSFDATFMMWPLPSQTGA